MFFAWWDKRKCSISHVCTENGMNVWNDMVSVIVAVWRVLSFYRKYHMYTQSTYVTSCPPQPRGSRRRRQPNRLRVNMNTKYCAQSKCAKCPTGF